MINVANVRTDIQDKPRVVPPMSGPPETLGTGDGSQTQFFFQQPNVLLNSPMMISLGVQTGTSPNISVVYSQKLANDATYGWSLITNVFGTQGIQFNTAPPSGTVVGARYQICMFSDDEIGGYLSRALAAQGGDDRKTLLQCKSDLIGVILMNDDKFRVLTLGDTKSDPSQIRAALQSQQAQAYAELSNPQATSGPALSFGCAPNRPYIS